MKIGIIIILMCVLFTSCQSILCIDEESSYKDITDFGSQVKQEYHLQLVGLGGGCYKGLKIFNLTFLGHEILSLDESRVLFYNLANGFIEKINANEELKEKSNVDQFTIANIDLRLMFPNIVGQIRCVGNGEAFNRDPLQFVYFFIHNAEIGPVLGHKEPYEELRSIVESQLQCQF